MEWPEIDIHVIVLLAMAVMVFLLPTALHAKNLWHDHLWHVMSWAADAVLVVATYIHMVRGPLCSIQTGALRGKVCIITGCNTGIGLETAKAMACAGATVIFACRNEQKAHLAIEHVLQDTRDDGVLRKQLQFLALDVSSFESIPSLQKHLTLHMQVYTCLCSMLV